MPNAFGVWVEYASAADRLYRRFAPDDERLAPDGRCWSAQEQLCVPLRTRVNLIGSDDPHRSEELGGTDVNPNSCSILERARRGSEQ